MVFKMISRCSLLGLLVLAGCSQPSTVSVPDPVSLEGPRTWYGSIGPLVGARCGICHRAGDIGPFPLESIDDVTARLPIIKAAVEQGRMPPFPPDQTDASGCPKISDVRQMSATERALLLAWIADGAPLGDPHDMPKTKPNKPLGDPTDRWKMPEPYTSKVMVGDDYRCFPVMPGNATAIPVQAISIEPGTRSVVHHSAVYLVPPDQLDKVKAMDAADEGPGYTCFGGVGLEVAYPAGLWVPGNDAPLVPPHEGVGYYLPAGWGFVVQNHYNFTGTSVTDQSSVVLWRGPLVITEVPHDILVGDFALTIPPHAMATAEASGILSAQDPQTILNEGRAGRIYAVWGHMHLVGKTFDMDLVHPDGTSQCLLHIPKWDFHWQSLYKLNDFVDAKPGDKVRIRCGYDNMNGDKMITYGENTSDEMCLGSVAMLDP